MNDADPNSVYYPLAVSETPTIHKPFPCVRCGKQLQACEICECVWGVSVKPQAEVAMRSDIAEGRAKQQAAEKEREAYSAEEMTLREKWNALKAAYVAGDFVTCNKLLGVKLLGVE